jgi:hypothetical protein
MEKCGVFFELLSKFLLTLWILCTMFVKWTHIGLAVSVCTIIFEKRWTNFDEIWFRRYVIEVYPRSVQFSFLQSVIPTWRTKELVMWDETSATYISLVNKRKEYNTNFMKCSEWCYLQRIHVCVCVFRYELQLSSVVYMSFSFDQSHGLRRD